MCSETLLSSFFVLFVFDCHCSHLGFTLTLHQSAVTLRGTPCVKYRRLESKIRVFVLPCMIHILVSKMLVWHHLPTRLRNTLDEAVKAFAFCLVLNTFSAVTTIACCRFRQARTTITTADGKVADSRCFATCLMV